MRFVKEQRDKPLRDKYATKAADCLYSFTYFVFSTWYGWSVLKETPYLPWLLGGQTDGSHTKIPIDTFYVPVDTRLYQYSFVTWGYHLNSLVCHLFLD